VHFYKTPDFCTNLDQKDRLQVIQEF